jgi:hypothetical protein
VDYDQTRLALEALHHYGFTITIHSPLTSPDSRYMVTAYGLRDETLRASAEHLNDAVQAVARKLGTGRLSRYARNNLDALLLTGSL